MKKAICISLSIMICLSSISIYFGHVSMKELKDKEIKAIYSFVDEVVRLSRNYSIKFCNNAMANSFENEFDLTDFQTSRLIVQSNNNFNKYNAIEHISGFQDFHILQYESPEEAVFAFLKYQSDNDVLSVYPDKLIDTKCLYNKNTSVNAQVNLSSIGLCDWSKSRTNSKRVLDYLNNANFEFDEVVVGIVDSGIDYNHSFLRDRVKRTYFNATNKGLVDDEMDSSNIEEALCHGTAVASVIVDNTPSNVKVASYKVFYEDEISSISVLCAGVLQAILDKVDVISLSIDLSGPLANSCLEEAYKNNIPICIAVGNSSMITDTIAADERSISVFASDINNTYVSWNNSSPHPDITAPGDMINVATYGDTYSVWSGTSFAAPCVASLVAILKSVNKNFTIFEIENKIKMSAIEIENEYGYSNEELGMCLVQFDKAIGLESLEIPKSNLNSTRYINEQTCSLTCDDLNAKILYTIDGTYPSIENAKVYTKPFLLSEYTTIRYVAYYEKEKYYSDEARLNVRICHLGSESDFSIDSDGNITNYFGEIGDLIIPESINGIIVKGFTANAFNKNSLYGVVLPSTITSISDGEKFNNNKNIRFFTGNNVTYIGKSAFRNIEGLREIEFPKVEIISSNAFSYSSLLLTASFPNAKIIQTQAFFNSDLCEFYGPKVSEIGNSVFAYCRELNTIYLPNLTKTHSRGSTFRNASSFIKVYAPNISKLNAQDFYSSKIVEANFPNVESITSKTFQGCDYLDYINLPKLKIVPTSAFSTLYVNRNITREYYFNSVYTIEENAFNNNVIERIEFSKLIVTKSLPPIENDNCKIALPSTFSGCTEDTQGRNYIIYGSSGTYAEQWANENGHKFIEISQDTAIMSNIDDICTKNEELKFDCIGFNKTYQWYGAFDNSTNNGVAIEGATNELLNIEEHSEYPFYYCVCTSTDIDEENSFEHQELIYSNVCHNTDYNISENTAIGDVDFNGIIDENDYAMLLSYVQCQATLTDEQKAVSDFNSDTVIDAFDVIWLDLYLNGVINIDGTGVNYIKGDVNEDGAVSIEDYSTIKSYLAGTVELTGTNYYEADVNNDSAVDAFDLYYVDTYVNKCYQGRILK